MANTDRTDGKYSGWKENLISKDCKCLGSALYSFIRVVEAYFCYSKRPEWAKMRCYPNIYANSTKNIRRLVIVTQDTSLLLDVYLELRYGIFMHIITRKRIIEFSNKYPDCNSSLNSWYRILKHSTVTNFTELRSIFPSVDQVQGLTVFNIGGNKARLIAAVHYNTQRVFIRNVLTHREYDKNKWKED